MKCDFASPQMGECAQFGGGYAPPVDGSLTSQAGPHVAEVRSALTGDLSQRWRGVRGNRPDRIRNGKCIDVDVDQIWRDAFVLEHCWHRAKLQIDHSLHGMMTARPLTGTASRDAKFHYIPDVTAALIDLGHDHEAKKPPAQSPFEVRAWSDFGGLTSRTRVEMTSSRRIRVTTWPCGTDHQRQLLLTQGFRRETEPILAAWASPMGCPELAVGYIRAEPNDTHPLPQLDGQHSRRCGDAPAGLPRKHSHFRPTPTRARHRATTTGPHSSLGPPSRSSSMPFTYEVGNDRRPHR